GPGPGAQNWGCPAWSAAGMLRLQGKTSAYRGKTSTCAKGKEPSMFRAIRFAVASAAAAAAIAIVPASAAATTYTTPDHLDFGSVQVGTLSPHQMVTLTAPCTLFVIFCVSAGLDTYYPDPSVGSDYTVDSGCPASILPASDGTSGSCSMGVRFKPTATGT